jgi:hypothetical protein
MASSLMHKPLVPLLGLMWQELKGIMQNPVQEARLLWKLRHTNVVTLTGVCIDQGQPIMLMVCPYQLGACLSTGHLAAPGLLHILP